MADVNPWLTIVGLGEDGPDGLGDASRQALEQAEIVMGPPRHLALIARTSAEQIEWPVPFSEGIEQLQTLRGRKVVVLASGDPFWFGAGGVLARTFARDEWVCHPVVSSFALVAARLGWPLEQTKCMGLHAAPLDRLRPHLAGGQRLIVLLRDGAAVADLAAYLAGCGFGESLLHVMEALGGPRERQRQARANAFDLPDIAHPVCVGIEPAGGPALPLTNGLADTWFAHDGQITKQPVRAITMAALAPRIGETLWDIGGGSGSIPIEWLLAHPANHAVCFEADPGRTRRIAENAGKLGADRLKIIEGRAPDCLAGLPPPDAVFVGGGLSQHLLQTLWPLLPAGCRVVANAVTLESEALLQAWHADKGGSLTRVEISTAAPLGQRRGWKASYPVVQWCVAR